jgi:hypothetical protein
MKGETARHEGKTGRPSGNRGIVAPHTTGGREKTFTGLGPLVVLIIALAAESLVPRSG